MSEKRIADMTLAEIHREGRWAGLIWAISWRLGVWTFAEIGFIAVMARWLP